MARRISRAQRSDYLAFANGLINKTRALIRKRSRAGFKVRVKQDESFVTDVDTAAEALLRAEIARRFPAHGIIGEEFAASNPEAEFQWILDPIDGTENFARGTPTFGTMLALRHGQRPIVAVIDHPALNLCYSAGLGLGAWCNGERIRLSRPRAPVVPEKEIVCTTAPANYLRFDDYAQFDALMQAFPNTRIYRDCFAHTRVIHGKASAMVDVNVRLWDIAASELLIEEAGGKFVLLRARTTHANGTYYSAMFGRPAVVEALRPLFQQV